MNCYELLRSDGVGTGIWACGECHKPHIVAWCGPMPVSDMNRQAAEKCCAPRDCRDCGQPTERDVFEQYKWAHDGCVPKYEPEPPSLDGQPVCAAALPEDVRHQRGLLVRRLDDG